MNNDSPASKIVVAIPAYNEEDRLPVVIRGIRRSLGDENEALVLVVDDGSLDRTAEVAMRSGADIVIRHTKNMGVACAYRTALQSALYYGAGIVCTIDGDGQFHPDDMLKLIRPIQNGTADLVIGSRFVSSFSERKVPISNRIANKVIAMLMSLLIGTRLHDVESGYRALSRPAAEGLELLGRVSFSHDMILDLSRKGFRILEVPVKVTYFNDRVSRAIPGFLKYGFKALGIIALKSMQVQVLLNGLLQQPPRMETVLAPFERSE